MNIHNNIYCSLLILGLMACGGGSETDNTPVENTAAAEAAAAEAAVACYYHCFLYLICLILINGIV